ncbi:MAG: hypothetical protein C0513_03055 [Isosphaera sp.]|nr:hypothetical protein [Isosphaera sp.]
MLRSVTLAPADDPHTPQALVMFRFQGSSLDGLVRKQPEAVARAIRAAAERPEGTGETGKIAEAFPEGAGLPGRVLLVGLGKPEKFGHEALRSGASAAARRLAHTREGRVGIALTSDADEAGGGLDPEQAGRVIGEAFGLLAWDHRQFKGKGDPESKPRPEITLACDRKPVRRGIERGLALAGSVNLARTLSETPPNIATPAFVADQAKKLAKELGLGFMALSGKDLEKERLTGHINVGKASENAPVMVRLEYRPDKVKKGREKPAVLVGKTMCYDTGGLSLKVNNGMVGMKRDKDGGCAVLGAMHAIATVVRPARPVVAILCAAENSVSDEAYRPDDVLTFRNGVTVEVTNTDAEGRLVLADGLCWACEKEDPAYIIDLATLTGGVVTALGSTYCGMFCEDDDLRGRVERAAALSAERVWRLPMHQEYREMMKSPIADILNSNPNRKAHPIQGAAFLSYFVTDKVPWCHLDIAGVHATESDSGPMVKGPTGWGVRLLADLLAQD